MIFTTSAAIEQTNASKSLKEGIKRLSEEYGDPVALKVVLTDLGLERALECLDYVFTDFADRESSEKLDSLKKCVTLTLSELAWNLLHTEGLLDEPLESVKDRNAAYLSYTMYDAAGDAVTLSSLSEVSDEHDSTRYRAILCLRASCRDCDWALHHATVLSAMTCNDSASDERMRLRLRLMGCMIEHLEE